MNENINKLIKFIKIVGKLKRLKRTGWVRNNISSPESVAEHSFRTAILTMILASKFEVDQLKVIKMALVHDLAEAEIGDIVTIRGKEIVSDPKRKVDLERRAFAEITSLINQDDSLKLFEEFEENKTPEAKLVKQLDKLEMAFQASEYEKEYGIDLQEFFDSAEDQLNDYFLKQILKEIEK